MKTIAIILVIVAALQVGCVGAQAWTWENQDNSIPKEYPNYLLVLRYWGNVSDSKGDFITIGQGWVYLYEPYNSLDEVMKRLNSYTGSALSDLNNLVGLWRLGEEKNIVNQVFELKSIEHQAEVKVETKKWTEHIWKRKEKP